MFIYNTADKFLSIICIKTTTLYKGMDIELLKNDYVGAFIRLERYVNQHYYNDFCNFSEVSTEYRPLGGAESFELFSPLGSVDEVILSGNDKKGSAALQNFNFFFHPDGGYDYPMQRSKVMAFPTSSTCTVLSTSLSPEPVFIKTSIPKRISRFSRELLFTDAKHSMEVCGEIKSLCMGSKDFACLDEFAITSYLGVGCLFRSFSPFPKRKGFLIPMFSLCSFDHLAPSDEYLINQISEKTGWSIKSILRWVIENTISFWCKAALEKGLLLELHGQNLLMEVDNDFFPKRAVARDFCSVRIDEQARKKMGLVCGFERRVIGKSAHFPRDKEYSLAYDFFTCHHFLLPLIEKCCETYGLAPEKFFEFAKGIFKNYFPDGGPFPKKPYGYTDDIFVEKPPELTELDFKLLR